MNKKLPKIVVILGPTASGKTDLGIFLAKKFKGEIISADSRQIYKKMSIGTDKPKGQWSGNGEPAYMVEDVPHYMMDIVDPGKPFTLADYQKQTVVHIKDILKRKKLPIIVGGTGLYIWAIVDNLDIPKMAPNKKLRDSFEEKKIDELILMLKKMDPESANSIDLSNPRRVVRALEVFINTGESFVKQRLKSAPLFDALQIGLAWPREIINERINVRCDHHVSSGLVDEVKSLANQNYGWNLPSMSSIGYRQIGAYLRGEMSLEEAIIIFKRDTRRYAKKQMTWFKRDKRIVWVEKGRISEAEEAVKFFLKPQ